MSDEQLLLLQLPDEEDDEEANQQPKPPPKKKPVLRVRNPKYVTSGAANVMKEWPTHHAHTHFWLILGAIILLVLFIFLYITCFRKSTLGAVDETRKKCIIKDLTRIKQLYKKIFGPNKKTPDEICKELSDKDRALIEFENSTADNYSLITDCNIFYVHDDTTPFSHLKACALESALRFAPEKQFFLIKLEKCSPKINQTEENSTVKPHTLVFDLTTLLKNDYLNLKTITTEGCKYFSGSPFQDLWKDGSELAQQAARVMTAWRFGGTVLSLDALVTNRKLFDQVENSVEVSNFVLRSRLQCNTYIRELMLEMRKKMVSGNSTVANNTTSDDLINDAVNKSLESYCHNVVGCHGVKKTEKSKICDRIEEQCYLLNFKNWRKENVDWRNSIRYFCPTITKSSLNFTINDNEHKSQT